MLRLLSSRLSLREIGNELYVSLNTIKTHTRNVYAKLRVGSRQQAVIRARELGLLGRPERRPALTCRQAEALERLLPTAKAPCPAEFAEQAPGRSPG